MIGLTGGMISMDNVYARLIKTCEKSIDYQKGISCK